MKVGSLHDRGQRRCRAWPAAAALLLALAGCSTTDGLGSVGPAAQDTGASAAVQAADASGAAQNAAATLTTTTTSAPQSFGMVAVVKPRFSDRDPHNWSGRTPFGYEVHGIDVSKYQKNVDWAKARDNGISFAFVKATEGGDRVDDNFGRHWRGARDAGIPRAAYHFYYFCRPAEDQARWFMRNVPAERMALPPVLDIEWNPASPTCKLRPDRATVRSEMSTFLSMLEKHYGKKPIIYTSIDFFEDNQLSSFRGYPYWVRSVADHPSDRYGDHPFLFWQYTGTGVVPGVRGDADINVFNGDVATWRKWLRANAR